MFRAALDRAQAWLDGLERAPWPLRLLIAAMFLESGIDKVVNRSTYLADVAAHHIPLPAVSLTLVTLVELAGGIAVLFGVAVVPALVALGLYTLVVNFFYFDFWAQPMPGAVMTRKEFLKNLAVIGGLWIWALTAWKARRR